jgi:hypothetical protein
MQERLWELKKKLDSNEELIALLEKYGIQPAKIKEPAKSQEPASE